MAYLNKNEIFKEDNKVAFGRFPKSIVFDNELISKLNNLESVNNIVSLDGEDYLKISKGIIEEAIEYDFVTTSGDVIRKKDTSKINLISNNDIYFKIEPIIWKIIDTNGYRYTLITEDVIFAHAYKYYTDDKRFFYNNYEESSIRNYLNNNFYKDAFNEDEKRCIIKTLVINQVESTKFTSNPYICANTFDYIYIPSFKDITSEKYKFVKDQDRVCTATPYAIELGARISHDDIYGGNATYYLRSPDGYYNNKVSMVNFFGSPNDIMDVTNEDGGIRCMMNIVIR